MNKNSRKRSNGYHFRSLAEYKEKVLFSNDYRKYKLIEIIK